MDDYSQSVDEDVLSLWPFVASAAAGLVLGLERHLAGAGMGVKGFTLIALFGTLVALLAEVSGSAIILAAGLMVVGAAGAAVSWAPGAAWQGQHAGERGGAQTIVAAVWCFGLGAAAWYGYTQAALVLAVVSALLLGMASPRGVATRRGLSDVSVTLQFVILAAAALPVALDQDYGPYGAFNPYHVWLVVVAATGLSWLGYAVLHSRRVAAKVTVAGFAGGAIGPLAVILAGGRSAAADPAAAPEAAAAAGAASLGGLLRTGLVAAAAMPRFLSPLAAILAAVLVCSLPALIRAARAAAATGPSAANPALRPAANPAGLLRVLWFGLAYVTALLAAAWVVDWGGRNGLLGLTLLSGFTPGGGGGLAALRLGSGGDVTEAAAVAAYGCAMASALAAQWLVAWRAGGASFARRCLPVLGSAAVGVGAGTAIAVALLAAGR